MLKWFILNDKIGEIVQNRKKMNKKYFNDKMKLNTIL